MISFLIICVSGLSIYWLLNPRAAASETPASVQLPAERPERADAEFHESGPPAVIPE